MDTNVVCHKSRLNSSGERPHCFAISAYVDLLFFARDGRRFALCCGDLQPLARNICLRQRYDNSLYPASIGDRFNCPHPAEMAIFIEIPISATTFCDLYAPMIVIGGNCENKCNRSRHHHSAQNTNEKYPNHLVFPP